MKFHHNTRRKKKKNTNEVSTLNGVQCTRQTNCTASKQGIYIFKEEEKGFCYSIVSNKLRKVMCIRNGLNKKTALHRHKELEEKGLCDSIL